MASVARRYIDAKTGDYQVASGGFRGDSGFTSKAVLALRTQKGSITVYPEFGSRIHEVRIADERGRKMAEKRAYEAVAHLADEVEDLTVVATLPVNRPGQIDITVSGRRGSTTYTANYTASVGG